MSPVLRDPSAAPLVSLLVLCYNHAAYLQECLDAVAAQTWPEVEIIILDNASTDGSAQLIEAWARRCARPVRLLLEQEPRGICVNGNKLLAAATGRYVGIISTDDVWFPEKTARQVDLLEARGPEFAVAYADAVRIDPQGVPLEPASFIQIHRQFSTLPEGDVLLELLRGPFIPVPGTLVRREALVAVGSFDETLIYEDYDVWLRLAARWKFAADLVPACSYRVVPTSMIHTVAAQHQVQKIHSDARIMAKASLNPNLDEKTLRNLHRRITRLCTQIATFSLEEIPAFQSLPTLCPLPAIQLLTAQQLLLGPRPVPESQQMLDAAESHGWLSGTRAFPPATDAAAWHALLSAAPAPATVAAPQVRRWWQRRSS